MPIPFIDELHTIKSHKVLSVWTFSARLGDLMIWRGEIVRVISADLFIDRADLMLEFSNGQIMTVTESPMKTIVWRKR